MGKTPTSLSIASAKAREKVQPQSKIIPRQPTASNLRGRDKPRNLLVIFSFTFISLYAAGRFIDRMVHNNVSKYDKRAVETWAILEIQETIG